MREVPDYEPARTNLALLASQNEVALGETAAAVLPGGRCPPRRPPLKPSKTSEDYTRRYAKQN
jgi:hypothetical protein